MREMKNRYHNKFSYCPKKCRSCRRRKLIKLCLIPGINKYSIRYSQNWAKLSFLCWHICQPSLFLPSSSFFRIFTFSLLSCFLFGNRCFFLQPKIKDIPQVLCSNHKYFWLVRIYEILWSLPVWFRMNSLILKQYILSIYHSLINLLFLW